MRLLVDADTPCFASSIVHENDPLEIACMEVDQMINKTIVDTQATEWNIYLTGPGNFRYAIYPEYKANRIKMPTPKHLKEVKAHVLRSWGAILATGCEADDLLGIEQVGANGETCICSIDKDLNQIPGKHYHPGITRKGTWLIEPHFYDVSPEEALRFFYYQLLIGDSTDNIKGAVGIGPKKADKILEGLETPWDYYNCVKDYFSCEEELLMNARVLYIHQKPNDVWNPPTKENEDE